jgi:hypothetical protein
MGSTPAVASPPHGAAPAPRAQRLQDLVRRVEFGLFGPRLEVWREQRKRHAIDRLRRRTLVITPMEAAVRLLHLKRLLPTPLVALDLFGKAGIMKTLEYVPFAESVEFYEVYGPFAAHARRALPADKVTIRVADSIAAVRAGTTLRSDYSFVVMDNPISTFGGGYCENFDLFPAVFDRLAPRSALVFNAALDDWVAALDTDHVEHRRRRRAFFGAPLDAAHAANDLAAVMAGYARAVPADRFEILDLFPVPHPGDMMFLVMALARR